MKKTFLLLLFASTLSANPFTSFINLFRTEPKGVDGCKILNRDFSRGPVVDKSEWNTPCILEADITSQQLANVKDTADFLNARKKHASPETPAKFRNTLTNALTPVAPNQMVLPSEALTLSNKLMKFGCNETLEIIEPSNPFSVIEYNGEMKRHYYVGRMNLGLVKDAYASSIVEVVDERIKAEVKECRK